MLRATSWNVHVSRHLLLDAGKVCWAVPVPCDRGIA